MTDRSFLDWPFFEDRHRQFAQELDEWAAAELPRFDGGDVDTTCKGLVRALGEAGWLRAAVPEGDAASIDVRMICLARDVLARHAALADFAFAMQGLGTASVALAGAAPLRARVLAEARRGERIAAFALSEPDAGSDVAAISTTAVRVPEGWRIDGEKTWISNGGIATHYIVFARTGEGVGSRGLSAFFVEAATPGLRVAARIETIAPHPLALLRFENCVVPEAHLLGAPGEGFKVAMATLDIFRPSVGAAAVGLARRALEEGLARAEARPMFGGVLADLQLTQARLAEMATDVDAAALLVYRAAWMRDVLRRRITQEAAMAKLYATEAAQRVVDAAVQMFGGLGVASGMTVEALYREVRALRIYEGASEVQKLVIARQMRRGQP
jgi:acyl-CoA dehydrogenase